MRRKIKSIITYRCDLGSFQNQGAEANYYKSRETFVDQEGRLVEQIEYNQNGRHAVITRFAYDEKGQMSAKAMNYIQDETIEKYIYKYNEEGKQVEEIAYFNNELFERIQSDYNDNGDVIVRTRYDEEDNILEKDEFEYDGKKLIRHRHFEGGDEPEWVIDIEYDGDLAIKEKKLLFDGSFEVSRYKYNHQGKKTRSEVKDQNDITIGLVQVEYDEKGNAYRYTSETYGLSPSKMVNQILYDDKGRVTDNEYYDVLNGYLVIKESVSYDDEDNIMGEEVYEVSPNHSTKKIHYKTQNHYEYYNNQDANDENPL